MQAAVAAATGTGPRSRTAGAGAVPCPASRSSACRAVKNHRPVPHAELQRGPDRTRERRNRIQAAPLSRSRINDTGTAFNTPRDSLFWLFWMEAGPESVERHRFAQSRNASLLPGLNSGRLFHVQGILLVLERLAGGTLFNDCKDCPLRIRLQSGEIADLTLSR